MSTPCLRVLVILPMYGGSLPIGRYCIHALRDLGHVVETFEAPQFHSAFSSLKNLHVTSDRLEQLEGGFLQVISQAIMAQVESFEPDMVLTMAQAPMSRHVLRRLHKMHIPTAMWFVEDHKIFTYWRAFAPLYDVFAVIQKEPFTSLLKEAGQENVLYLPMAALPDFHARCALPPAEQREYGADISFLGAGYPNRRLAFRSLAHKAFKIWGTEWEGETLLSRNVQRQGARISPEDSVKIYSASRINLNLHSSVQSEELVPEGDFINPRTFELAAIGAFQLVDKRQLMDELFEVGSLATFSSVKEMLDKIDYYLIHQEERERMSQLARQQVLQRHTYQHRMQALLDYVESLFGPWKQRAVHETLPADFPEEMRHELGLLLEGLQLPGDASFEDVVMRVRQRTGTLNHVETTILFLDEWRKQYTKR